MAPATRERTSTRSTASSRPENSSHGTVSRGTTTDTETGRAVGAAATVAAGAARIRPFRKVAPPAIANTASASPAPSKGLFWIIFFMEDPIPKTSGVADPRLEQAGRPKTSTRLLRCTAHIRNARYKWAIDIRCQGTYLTNGRKFRRTHHGYGTSARIRRR